MKCQQCGNIFEVSAADEARGRGKYCGTSCYHASRNGLERLNIRKRKLVNCVICGNQFETGGRAGKRVLYCSRTCQAIGRVRVAKVNQMTLADSAYLAGLLDGEGSIIAAMKRRERITWRLVISNTDFDLLEWCKKVTGCGSIVRNIHDNPKWADAGAWQCYSWNARDILRQILPYLKIAEKVRRAQKMIAELNAIEVRNSSTPGG